MMMPLPFTLSIGNTVEIATMPPAFGAGNVHASGTGAVAPAAAVAPQAGGYIGRWIQNERIKAAAKKLRRRRRQK